MGIENKIKNIGVLTSGGDAPGMNAAIRSVVRGGIGCGFKVFGIRRGYQGLLNGDIEELTSRSVSETLQRGGTFLMTARSMDFMTEDGVSKAMEMAKIFKLDAVVTIGGDGTFRGAQQLARRGLPVIGLPGTIDNDIACTDYTIGFDTALNTAMEAIDKLRDTASSHERCSVIEVMGRRSGYIALHVGIAVGAEAILIPEKEYEFDKDVLKVIIDGRNRGKRHFIVVVAEGIGNAQGIAKEIEEKTGIVARATILGHLQRGGSPSVQDRFYASMMGIHAVECLSQGRFNRIVVLKDGEIKDLDLEEALGKTKTIDPKVVERAVLLSK